MPDNRYIDTRGHVEEPVGFRKAVIDGMARGGGLYVPQEIPRMALEDILALADLPYARRAAQVYRLFNTDLSGETIDAIMDGAYGPNFDDERICPITSLDSKTHILELWHGPTSAFKDMALQCLPRCFEASARELRAEGKIDKRFLILVATSGDTGKAALEGFRDRDGVQIGVMYPNGGVSDIQFKQMATQAGDNVRVWAVRGNFDDCQTGAKTVFGDEAFNESLASEKKLALSSANSINWGRLMPQIVYYISAYSQLVHDGKLEAGALLDVCVPTGNFGNILAAWYAKQMGTPIDMLFCASNENRVLADFINTGLYDISERPFYLTPSPSMDILVSSNLERQLFELTDRDDSRIRAWMDEQKSQRRFRVDPETFSRLRANFSADSANSAACFATIKEVYTEHGYLLDPHSAVAYAVAQRLRGDNPVLVASTAHWAKFGENVYRALHGLEPEAPLPEELATLTGCQLNEFIAKETGCGPVPARLAELDRLPIRFTEVIDGDAASIENAVVAFIDE